ncbi:ABC transporter ATP-binding protein [Neoactinobaculum massilliense]|uniref:ABC transporter ATP-binding protein n=1 Tax=Neoactinobaculum massilliense TaxID=2364794 RepID=UPI000F523B1A|nr:ABC transporter ATP-binding protein [Neoactinobaculum massilliense]
MITVEHLTKRYGHVTAVSDLSFSIAPGKVTGFLGPNGSGKSTTMRCIMGLDRPTSGRTTIGGVEYRKLRSPLTKVGALLDGNAFYGGRTARTELRAIARTHGISNRRVDEVLALTGLESVADKRTKGFSLGMGQRVGIARALLGDPEVLIFDEPVNGLDPDGVRWVRELMRALAAQGRTVLVSSHLMSEMAQTADNLVVIGRGKLIAEGPLENFINTVENTTVRVTGPDPHAIDAALRPLASTLTWEAPSEAAPQGVAVVVGKTRAEIGHALFVAGVEIHELTEAHRSLEDVFIGLTNASVEYPAQGSAPAQSGLQVGTPQPENNAASAPRHATPENGAQA